MPLIISRHVKGKGVDAPGIDSVYEAPFVVPEGICQSIERDLKVVL